MSHLQLTLRCNLKCPFCGQWGEAGYAREHGPGKEMAPEKWLDIIDQINALGHKPDFVLWGGEPLLYKGVDAVLNRIAFHGCRAAMVTNGALLAPHAEFLEKHLSTLYLSLDGVKEEHDKIRGSEGLHLKVEAGMGKLAGSKLKKICLATINDKNWWMMRDIALYAQSLGFGLIIFQNLIYNLPEDQKTYAEWLKRNFSISDIPDSWTFQGVPEFAAKLPAAYEEMEKRIENGEFKIKVEFRPKGLNSSNVKARMEGCLEPLPDSPAHCLAPERHINVAPDGNVRFCVDYNEFSLGSLEEHSLAELLSSEKAGLFRREIAAGRNPSCKRCPWRHEKAYEID